MNKSTLITLFLAFIAASSAPAQFPERPRKPPVGVPNDATLFNGKWYRTYLEKTTWKRAQEKCRTLGGQLACVPDAPTQVFLAKFGKGVELWIGATDEKVEGLWVWVDGTEVKYKRGWGGQPPNGGRAENYAALSRSKGHYWFSAPNDWPCVGFICEWKDK
jgi:Lectin C-type domain